MLVIQTALRFVAERREGPGQTSKFKSLSLLSNELNLSLSNERTKFPNELTTLKRDSDLHPHKLFIRCLSTKYN